MKKILSLILTMVLILSLAVGCGKKEVSKMESIKEKGKLVLGTSADYPPYEFHKEIDGKDEIVGFDIEIAKAIAEDLGVELEIKDMKFDGLLAALQAGNIDIVVAGMTATPERMESVDFSVPYYTEEHTIIVKKENLDKFNSLESLKGLKIGAQKTTVQESIAKENIEDAQIVALSKIQDLILQLKSDKVDAVVLAQFVAGEYAKSNDDISVAGFTIAKDDQGVSVAVKKGSEDLVAEIDKTLNKLMEENQIEQFITEASELAGE